MNRQIIPMLLGSAALLGALAGCSTSGDRAQGTDTARADTARADTTAARGAAPAATSPAATTAGQSGGAAAQGALLDPNSATPEQLRTVPGLSAAAADAIVAGRPYADMRAVDRVLVAQHLSEQQRDTVYTRLWRPIDLNSATADEILLIPGVGPRMRHEFEEYRPYRSIEQFRREIGKYVSRDEVARLERYVTIR